VIVLCSNISLSLPVQYWLQISGLSSRLGPEQKVAQSSQRRVTGSYIHGGGHTVVISGPTAPKQANRSMFCDHQTHHENKKAVLHQRDREICNSKPLTYATISYSVVVYCGTLCTKVEIKRLLKIPCVKYHTKP